MASGVNVKVFLEFEVKSSVDLEGINKAVTAAEEAFEQSLGENSWTGTGPSRFSVRTWTEGGECDS